MFSQQFYLLTRNLLQNDYISYNFYKFDADQLFGKCLLLQFLHKHSTFCLSLKQFHFLTCLLSVLYLHAYFCTYVFQYTTIVCLLSLPRLISSSPSMNRFELPLPQLLTPFLLAWFLVASNVQQTSSTFYIVRSSVQIAIIPKQWNRCHWLRRLR